MDVVKAVGAMVGPATFVEGIPRLTSFLQTPSRRSLSLSTLASGFGASGIS